MNTPLRLLLILALHDRVAEKRQMELNQIFELCKNWVATNSLPMRRLIPLWQQVLSEHRDHFQRELNTPILQYLDALLEGAIGTIDEEADELIDIMRQEISEIVQLSTDSNNDELPIEYMLRSYHHDLQSDPDYNEFKTIMEENFDGHPVDIRYGPALPEDLPAVRIFKYKDYPEAGFNTCLTYGLSLADYSGWTDTRPELAITLRSTMDQWGGMLGLMASRFRGESPSDSGCILTTNHPIGEDTAMQGLVIGHPAPFEINPIQLSNYKVLVQSVHPIYFGESELIDKIGVDDFLAQASKSGLHDIQRPDLSSSSGNQEGKVE